MPKDFPSRLAMRAAPSRPISATTRVGPNAPCFFWRGPCFTSPEKIGGLSVISHALALPSLTLGNNVSLPGSFVSLADACHVSSTDLLVWTQISQLSRHSFRPIASGQHPSAVAKQDQPTTILLDTGSVNRSGDLEVGVPIEDLLDAGAFTAWLEKLDRVSCNVGRHWPDSIWATEFPVFSTSVTRISSL